MSDIIVAAFIAVAPLLIASGAENRLAVASAILAANPGNKEAAELKRAARWHQKWANYLWLLLGPVAFAIAVRHYWG